MSKYQEGLSFESQQSLRCHQWGVPLLVSPVVLRNRGMGQIDLAFITNNEITIVECKKYGTVSSTQLCRLRLSAKAISMWLNMPAKLKVYTESFAK